MNKENWNFSLSQSEERLLVLLNLAEISNSVQTEIHQLIKKGIQWNSFFYLMEMNSVVPLTMKRIQELSLPCDQLQKLIQKASEIRAHGQRRMKEMNRMLQELSQYGIEVILLKGSLLGNTIYRDSSYKKMNDVDILVRFEKAEETVKVLKDLGFSSVGSLFGGEEVSSKNHHSPPFVSQDLSCVVGLHWGLHSKYSKWKSDVDGIWNRKITIQIGPVSAWQMSSEDNLLHLCFHLPFFKIGLRELADVYNLVHFCQPRIDWELFRKRAVEWGVCDPVYRVLSLANQLYSLSLPSLFLESFETEASLFCQKDTEIRMKSPLLLIQSRSVHIGKIEKAFSIFQVSSHAFEKSSAYLMMWKLTVWPKSVEVRKFNALYLNKKYSGWIRLKSRMKAPVLVWNAMARDYGNLPLALLTGMNLIKAIYCCFTFPFQLNSVRLLNHPSRKLLELLE